MAGFFRGTTPTLKFNITGADVATLGSPTIGIVQDMVFISIEAADITVNSSDNSISTVLSVDNSLLLVAGLPARAQVFFDDGDSAVATPVVEFEVWESLIESVLEYTVPGDDEEEE